MIRIISAVRIWQLLVGVLFLVAAATKLLDASPATAALAAVGVPARLAKAALFLTVGAEVALGLFLVLPRPPRGATLATVGLLLAFTAFLGVLVATKSDASCGCLGKLTAAGGTRENLLALVRNGVILAAGVGCALWDGRRARAPAEAALSAVPA
jgi:uncharacterized membrane protein YphA (DoxX/SURF4 family)